MQAKFNANGLVAIVFILTLILSIFLTSSLLGSLGPVVYGIFAILPYSLGIIALTHWREVIGKRLATGEYPISARERDISREDDEGLLFNLWRLLMGLHFVFVLLTFGSWLPVIFRVGSNEVTGVLLGYFIAAIAAGMLAPYLIWLRR